MMKRTRSVKPAPRTLPAGSGSRGGGFKKPVNQKSVPAEHGSSGSRFPKRVDLRTRSQCYAKVFHAKVIRTLLVGSLCALQTQAFIGRRNPRDYRTEVGPVDYKYVKVPNEYGRLERMVALPCQGYKCGTYRLEKDYAWNTLKGPKRYVRLTDEYAGKPIKTWNNQSVKDNIAYEEDRVIPDAYEGDPCKCTLYEAFPKIPTKKHLKIGIKWVKCPMKGCNLYGEIKKGSLKSIFCWQPMKQDALYIDSEKYKNTSENECEMYDNRKFGHKICSHYVKKCSDCNGHYFTDGKCRQLIFRTRKMKRTKVTKKCTKKTYIKEHQDQKHDDLQKLMKIILPKWEELNSKKEKTAPRKQRRSAFLSYVRQQIKIRDITILRQQIEKRGITTPLLTDGEIDQYRVVSEINGDDADSVDFFSKKTSSTPKSRRLASEISPDIQHLQKMIQEQQL